MKILRFLSLVLGLVLSQCSQSPLLAQSAVYLDGSGNVTNPKVVLPYRVVVLSQQSGVALNSDGAGGGTDTTAKIQAVLNTASAANPLHLVWDGRAKTSATLIVRSYTDIEFLPGAGLFLTAGSNCTAISNRVSGSAIADVNITIHGPGEIDCNGDNQSIYQGGVNLDSYTATGGVTNGTTTITYTADPNYGADNHRVAIGQAITGTDIPSDTVIASIQSANQATLSQAATGSHTGLSFSLAGGFADRVTSWNYGLWFAGFKGVHVRDITVRNAPSFALLFTNGSDFDVENVRAYWDDNIGPQTLGTGVTNATGTITYAADPNFGLHNAFVRAGGYVSGTDIPAGTFVGTVINSTSCTLVDGSGNPVVASGSATGITFTLLPTTNFSRDGVHMLGNLTDGRIRNFFTNGDGDAVAWNTDEGVNMGDSRRGSGGAISRIDAENIRLENATNTYRFFGANGIGTVDAITLRNWYGNIIQGSPGFSAATVGGTHYYGRVFGDEALAAVGSITLDGWFVSAAGGTNTANVNPKVLNSTSLAYVNIPPTLTTNFTGSVLGFLSYQLSLAELTSFTSAGNNVALGHAALAANTSGANNVGVGVNAGASLSTGNNNLFFGLNAGANIVGGSNNMVFGTNALTAADANRDVAVGINALTAASGGNNVAIGTQAGQGITIGQNNVVIGDTAAQSGTVLTTGNNNIVIGANTGVPSATADNQIVIGSIIVGNNIAITIAPAVTVTGVFAVTEQALPGTPVNGQIVKDSADHHIKCYDSNSSSWKLLDN